MLDVPKIVSSEPILPEMAIDPDRHDRAMPALDEAETRAWDEAAAMRRYNERYNNRTYMQIRPALEAPFSALAEDADTIMNWVIDACLEMCGYEFYEGAAGKLFKAIAGYPDVIRLVVAHLANFS